MNDYTDHNDAKGRDTRLRVQAWMSARARMLATFMEHDLGAVTLFMPKYEIQARCREASFYKLGVR